MLPTTRRIATADPENRRDLGVLALASTAGSALVIVATRLWKGSATRRWERLVGDSLKTTRANVV